MDYRIKLVLKAIAVLILIAAVTIGVRVYWSEHSIMQRWGSTLVIVNMFLNMAVIVIFLVVMNSYKRASNR